MHFNTFASTFVWQMWFLLPGLRPSQARRGQNSKKKSILPNKCARKVVWTTLVNIVRPKKNSQNGSKKAKNDFKRYKHAQTSSIETKFKKFCHPHFWPMHKIKMALKRLKITFWKFHLKNHFSSDWKSNINCIFFKEKPSFLRFFLINILF